MPSSRQKITFADEVAKSNQNDDIHDHHFEGEEEAHDSQGEETNDASEDTARELFKQLDDDDEDKMEDPNFVETSRRSRRRKKIQNITIHLLKHKDHREKQEQDII